jgi:hypothetical protein
MNTQEIKYTKHNFNKEDYWSQELEERIRDQFAATLPKCAIEVQSKLGRIDILTPEAIYEVKRELNLGNLQKAVGQLMCYSYCFPNRQKYIITIRTKHSIPPIVMEALSSWDIKIIEINC